MSRRKRIISQIIDSETISQGSYVITGFSGGPDSLCLLHALSELRDILELEIVPVHVNHKLRENAYAEAENAVMLCERLGLDCVCFEADCMEASRDAGISTEEAGRLIRYEIFDEVAADLEASGVPRDKIVIALAHNADDQSETVLFRLVRGTGGKGLAGISRMRLSDQGFMIVRPILSVTRQEIEGYVEETGLKPNIDESNSTNDYARNRIRNELLPYLEKNFNPSVKDALRKYASIANEDNEFLEGLAMFEAESCLEVLEDEGAVKLDASYIRELPLALARRLISMVFSIMNREDALSYRQIRSITDLINSDNPSGMLNLAGGIVARRNYGFVVFRFAEDDEALYPGSGAYNDAAGEHDKDEELLELNARVLLRREYEYYDKTGRFAAFDYDEFNRVYPGQIGSIELRTRREGDYIAIKDGKRKKIQDVFVDQKVPKIERDSVLMAAIGSEVLWILPSGQDGDGVLHRRGKYSQNYQITDTSGRVLFLELISTLC
ncbi:MAG: tRNA lysidine(34) synthetase TilS [Anaerovoracaceae bacterium]